MTTASSQTRSTALALPKHRERDAEIALRLRSFERHAPRIHYSSAARYAAPPVPDARPALALAETRKREDEIHLRQRPIERHTLARTFLQRRRRYAVDSLLQTRRPALALPKLQSAAPRLFCVRRPIERHVLARLFLQRDAIGRRQTPPDAPCSLSRSPKPHSAAPRFSATTPTGAARARACIASSAVAIRCDSLLQAYRPLSRSPSVREREAEIRLRQRPIERHTLERPLLQRSAIGRDSSPRDAPSHSRAPQASRAQEPR